MAFKSDDGVKTRKVLLTLDEETIEVFRAAGDGNVSLGARIVAKGGGATPRKTVKKVLTAEEQYEAHCKRQGVSSSVGGFIRWKRSNGF